MFFNANIIEQISRIIAEHVTGSKLTNILENLHIRPSDDYSKDTKWRRINNAIVINQNSTHSGDALIKIVEYIMSPVNFTDLSPEDYKAVMVELNTVLSFSGLQITEDGKIIVAKKSTTLSDAQSRTQGLLKSLEPFKIHPQLLYYCKPEILSNNYFHLILESSKCLLQELKRISQLQSDGNKLIGECFDGINPLVVFNHFSTDDEKSEHKGLESLLKYIVYCYRNPKAHDPKIFSVDSKQDAISALIIMSKGRYLLDKCSRNPSRK